MLKRLLLGTVFCGLSILVALQPQRGAAQSMLCQGEETPTVEPPVPGGRIAFTAGNDAHTVLNAVNANGTGLTTLIDDSDASVISEPQWSHNSKFVVFAVRDSFGMKDRQPGQDIEVFPCGGTLLNRTAYNDDPAWSPNDSAIAFTSDVFSKDPGNISDLYVMNADGTYIRELTRPEFLPGLVQQPEWSPNGRCIAYLDIGGHWGHTVIVSVDRPGNCYDFEPNFLVGASWGGFPAWSPSRPQIAFSLFNEDGIYLANLDGSNLVKLSDITVAYHPVFWSPDGKWLAFLQSSDVTETHAANLYILQPSQPHRLINLTNNISKDVEYSDPAWSPDSKRIAFIANQSGTGEVYTINVDGSKLQQLTRGAKAVASGGVSWSQH
jgi:Tol biopolymer transport system component